MKFGAVKTELAEGTILAHSLQVGTARMRKGRVLSTQDITQLLNAKIDHVTVASLDANDIDENQAAKILGAALVPDADLAHLNLSAPFTGRVNIYAQQAGLVEINTDAITQFNSISHDITVATLPNLARVAKRDLVATVKIIPYGVPSDLVAQARQSTAIRVVAPKLRTASLILTSTEGTKQSLLTKAQDVVAQRLQFLDCRLIETVIVPHDTHSLEQAIKHAPGEVILVLTSSATSDIADVGPAALLAAGGEITRFGMPVDPGNLLFLGRLGLTPVIGLPGCARSPALNGADWVLERIVCGLSVNAQDIAAMGVGGLLKEIPTRPHPRGAKANTATRPKVEIILLAAGNSSRMEGGDKLLEDVKGIPMLRHAATIALASHADQVQVVLQPDRPERVATLTSLNLKTVISNDWSEGMAASIRAGIAAVSDDCDAVIIALADMPDLTANHFDRLIASFSPGDGREICRALTESGVPGLPVLFGARFFETLQNLTGDRGAKHVIDDSALFVTEVPTNGLGAITDLDTPSDWKSWRSTPQKV